MATIEARRKQLEDRLHRLRSRLRKIDAELDQTRSKMSAEAAIERESDEVLEDLAAAGQQEIRMIEAALKRIDRDEYGICVDCGDPISDERLDIIPQTPKCRNCAA